MAITHMELRVERDTLSWYAGEEVRGQLIVTTDAPTRAGALSVQLISERPAPLSRRSCVLHEVLCGERAALPAGRSELPFTLRLPHDLFPSYRGHSFSASYLLAPAFDDEEQPGAMSIAIWPCPYPAPQPASLTQGAAMGRALSGSSSTIAGIAGIMLALGAAALGALLFMLNPLLGLVTLLIAALVLFAGGAACIYGYSRNRDGLKGTAEAIIWPQVAAPGQTLQLQLTLRPTRDAMLHRAHAALEGAETITEVRSRGYDRADKIRHITHLIHQSAQLIAQDQHLTPEQPAVIHATLTLPAQAVITARERLPRAPLSVSSLARASSAVAISISWRVCLALELEGSDVITIELPVTVAHLLPAPHIDPSEQAATQHAQPAQEW